MIDLHAIEIIVPPLQHTRYNLARCLTLWPTIYGSSSIPGLCMSLEKTGGYFKRYTRRTTGNAAGNGKVKSATRTDGFRCQMSSGLQVISLGSDTYSTGRSFQMFWRKVRSAVTNKMLKRDINNVLKNRIAERLNKLQNNTKLS